MKPRVSILLPFRDAAATLPGCLESILTQTLADWELVAIDDHSRDGSRELVARLAARDRRVRLLDNRGRGLVDALNQGLMACRAPLVARMDADDLMAPERLAAQVAHLESEPDLSLSACCVRGFPEDRLQKGFREYLRWQNACLTPEAITREIYVESPFAHPSVCYRRAVVLAAGGYRLGRFPEDYELWLRLHHAGHRMAKLPQTLLDWRDHPRRLSRTDPRCARGAFDRLRAHYLARDPRLLARRDDFVVWGAGRKTRRRFDHLAFQGFRPRAWVDIDPRKIGNRVDGVPVVDSRWLAANGRPLVLIYVTNHGAREEILAELVALGYRPGEDCLAVG